MSTICCRKKLLVKKYDWKAGKAQIQTKETSGFEIGENERLISEDESKKDNFGCSIIFLNP